MADSRREAAAACTAGGGAARRDGDIGAAEETVNGAAVASGSAGVTMAPGKRRGAARGPDAIDVHIGQRIRRRRQMLGVNQRSIAERLGRTFQAVQKYEKGENRVAASTLLRIAKILGVTLDYFVAELPDGLVSVAPVPESDKWIMGRRGRSLGAAIEEMERVALRAVRPLMALPPEVRDAMIGHIAWLARVLGDDRNAAGKEPRDGR